ncbi:MAG: hypothetical protein Q8N56_01785 [bacterium]|nr:hypothetical protein [bacterium]
MCKRMIKDDAVTVSRSFGSRVELCQKCGTPVIKFLEKNKLTKSEKHAY